MRVMKEWLKATLYVAFFLVIIVIFAALEKSNDNKLKRTLSPAAYAEHQSEVRVEGLANGRDNRD